VNPFKTHSTSRKADVQEPEVKTTIYRVDGNTLRIRIEAETELETIAMADWLEQNPNAGSHALMFQGTPINRDI
jgi:hypothetical protein